VRTFLLPLPRARPVSNRPASPGHSYNQTRGDFATDREYNDYLEEVEDLSATLLSLALDARSTA
jgi:CDK-activating kinase assembly factor MAT1